MARQIGQKMRFTDEELALTKALFSGNEELLFAVRKVMIGAELNGVEAGLVAGMMNDETKDLMQKFFLPGIDPDAPLFQLTDPYIALVADAKTMGPDEMWPLILAKDLEVEFIQQQLDVLKAFGTDTKVDTPIKLAGMISTSRVKTKREDAYVGIMARNFLISFVDSNIHQMQILAGSKEETVEETKERLAKNSAK